LPDKTELRLDLFFDQPKKAVPESFLLKKKALEEAKETAFTHEPER
jgi:hypothetical protein